MLKFWWYFSKSQSSPESKGDIFFRILWSISFYVFRYLCLVTYLSFLVFLPNTTIFCSSSVLLWQVLRKEGPDFLCPFYCNLHRKSLHPELLWWSKWHPLFCFMLLTPYCTKAKHKIILLLHHTYYSLFPISKTSPQEFINTHKLSL